MDCFHEGYTLPFSIEIKQIIRRHVPRPGVRIMSDFSDLDCWLMVTTMESIKRNSRVTRTGRISIIASRAYHDKRIETSKIIAAPRLIIT